MGTLYEPRSDALDNVTEGNIASRAELLPEEAAMKGSGMEQIAAEVILAESEERTVDADPDDAQGGHRQSSDTADLP